MAKINYNDTTSDGVSIEVAPAMASRRTFYFKAITGNIYLNFGASAGDGDVLLVETGDAVIFDNAEKDPYDFRKAINAYSTGDQDFEAQADE